MSVLVLVVLLLTLNGCGPGSPPPRQGSGAPAGPAVDRPAEGPLVEGTYLERLRPDGTRIEAGGYKAASTREAGGAESGVFVRHVGSSGESLWTHHFASAGGASIQDLVVRDTGGAVATGWSVGPLAADRSALPSPTPRNEVEFFLFSLNELGRCRWMTSTRVRGSGAYATGEVIVDLMADGCVVCGDVNGSALFGEGEPNECVVVASPQPSGFLASYDECGQLLWVRKLAGRVATERGLAVCASTGGTTLVAVPTIAGRGCSVSSYASDGSRRWVRTVTGTGAIACEGCVLTKDGSHVLTGWFLGDVIFRTASGESVVRAGGTVDLFVVSYSAAGHLRWIRTIGGEGEATAVGQRVTAGADGTLAVRGAFTGRVSLGQPRGALLELASSGDEDHLLAMFDGNGRPLSLRRSVGEIR